MKTKKLTKVTSVVLALLMALSIMCVAPFTADAAGKTKSEAITIAFDQGWSGTITNTDSEDWFKFYLTESGHVEIDLDPEFDYMQYELTDESGSDLGFYASGAIIRGSRISAEEIIEFDLTKGTYYLRIHQVPGLSVSDYYGGYWFRVSFTSANVSFEEPQGGSDNTKDTANAINLNQTYNGQIANNDSSDWYKLNVPSAGKVKLSMTSLAYQCHFELFDVNDNSLVDTNITGNNKKSASETRELDLPAGDYYLHVSCLNEWSTGNYSFSFEKVTIKPTSVKLNRGTLGLGVGEAYGLVKTVSPSNANQAVSWTSSNSSVASVDASGKVTGKKAGSATVTVKTANGLTASCNVTVKAAPTSVKTNPANLTLGQGETYTISESTSAGSYANAANLRWSTSDANVVKVAKQNGTNKATLTAAGTGTATVTIKIYNGLTAQCKVTVKPAPSSVSTNPASVTLGNGETYTIAENTNAGSYANAANLKWSSSNTKVATVTKGSGNKAVVKAVGKGTANVTIRLYNGKTATCKVTVKDAPKTVSITKSSLTLKKGQSYTVAENTNAGSYANAANLKWSSSNNKVATVTKGSGNKATIKAVGKGTANVTIRLYNGKTATCKVTVK